MSDLQALFQSLFEMLAALAASGKAIGSLAVEHWPLVLWIVFWTFLVRWPDLRPWLARGAWLPCFLLYLIVCIVWAVCSGPGLQIEDVPLGSMGEKLLLGGIWIAVALLCGRVQEVLGLTPAASEIAGPPDGVPVEPGQPAGDHGHAAAHGHH